MRKSKKSKKPKINNINNIIDKKNKKNITKNTFKIKKNTVKKSIVKKSITPIWTIFIVVLCTFFTAFGQYFIKRGINQMTDLFSLINFNIIGGLALYGVGAFILVVALRYGSLSVLYPIIALGFVWVALLGTVFLGESLNFTNWLGILGIMIGVTLVGVSERND